ncbi:MAG: ABC transporter substrate-binding protein [Desulfarculus sp.]|nr:ABC transporter substrate-binding protein [Desulfarculus sp.]
MTRHGTSFRLAAGLLLLLVLLAGCGRTDQTQAAQDEVLGVSDSEILLGSSLALKGHASYLGTQTLSGAMCYINKVNEAGGVHGRTIRVIAYDDGYDPPMCLSNTQRLIVEDAVFALFCYVGTPTAVKILPMVEEAKIPLLGLFTGANALREPFNRYIFNVRASYYQEIGAAIRHMVKDLGLSRIAVFYQYDAYGFDGLTGVELALKELGLAPVARGSYIRGTVNVEEGLNRIAGSGAQAVAMIGTYEPCAKFINLANQRDFKPLFYAVSFVGAEELARRLDSQDRDLLILSQVVPPLQVLQPDAMTSSAREYVDLLRHYFPEEKPNLVGLEGFINARVLVEGLHRAGRQLTRERFIEAIESIQGYSLGQDIMVSFSPTNHQGMEQVFFTGLEDGEFVLIRDWDDIRKAIASRRETKSPAEKAKP